MNLYDLWNYLPRFSVRQRLLVLLFFSYSWIPMRRKLLKQNKSEVREIEEELDSYYIQQQFADHTNEQYTKEQLEGHWKIMDQWLPAMNRFCRYYFMLSTIIHAFNSIAGVILIYDLNNRFTGYMSVVCCYFPRLILHEFLGLSTSLWLAWCLSVLHIIWRFLIVVYRGEFKLNAILFMLIDPKQIELASNPMRATKLYHNYQTPKIIQDLLFYKVEYKMKNNVKLYLRPNRLPENRDTLCRILNNYYFWSSLVFVPSSLVFFLIGLRIAYFKLSAVYPYCEQTGYDLLYLYRFLTSSTLSIIVLIDSMFAAVISPSVGALLIGDLKCYWSHVEEELKKMVIILQEPEPELDKLEVKQRKSLNEFGPVISSKYTLTGSADSSIGLERRKYQLQMMVRDFFQQLEEANHYVSCLLSFSLLIWLSVNAVVTFTGLQTAGLSKSTVVFLVRCVQLAGLLIIVLLSLHILALKRSTESAYTTISSIMTNDQSVDKKRWRLLLKYYTGKPKHAFTAIFSDVYTFSMLLKTLSYTITLFFFVHNLHVMRLNLNV